MTVIPVAGYDSPLLNLSGCHGPVFIRNLVLLEDNAGHIGVGETPGGEKIRRTLQDSADIIQGSRLGEMSDVLNRMRSRFGTLDAGGRGKQTFDQRVTIHAITGVEASCLDLLGQVMGVPVAKLLGDGIRRDQVEVLGYLFFIADYRRIPLDYNPPVNPKDEWDRLRFAETLDAEGIVRQAVAAQQRFGFNTFKLKGGILPARQECDCISAIADRFQDAGLTIDPNGCWSLEQAVEYLFPIRNILTYAEDPCGAERGFSGREILSEFRRETGIPTATNMVAVNEKELIQAIRIEAVDIPLADCHFWTMQGAVDVSGICEQWGLTWGSHSNNHFDISLAMMTHVAAAARGKITPIDTHWIWQEGQQLTVEPLEIRNGLLRVPDGPGLGVKPDQDRVMKAHKLYRQYKVPERDDSIAMRHLRPGWTFNAKRPCLG